MKKLILILVIVFPFLANGQDYRVVDWKTDVLNVQTVGIDTFKFDAEPKDYNDAGAITREIGNYFIDYVARCFKIIDSDANTITVVDLEHINSAPQSNQIGRVYQSVVDADSLFESIGGVDISVLDQMSIFRDVARNNEIICRLLKELYLKDATYRQKTDHDSLSALDEKSYNSLTDKPTSLPASDVYPWAKAGTKPTYTKSEVGLGNVDNTSDASKPISTATQTALNAKLAISDTTNKWQPKGTYLSSFTETDPTVSALVKSIDATDTTYWGRAETDPTVSAWAKAGTKPTYTKSEVGLGNVDNTSDASKPISTATQTALNNLVPYTGAISDLDMGANSINTDTVKIDGTPLLLDAFKSGSIGGAGTIPYSNGASSQLSWGSVNQVFGGNSLTTGYVPKWDGSKLVNSSIFDNGNLGIGTNYPTSQLTQKSTTALESAPLGSELLTASNWTSTGWTGDFTTGFTHTTGNTTALSNTFSAVTNNYYQIAFTVTGRTAGTFTVSFGGVTSGGYSSTSSFDPKSISTGNLIITPTTDFNGTIVISVKKTTGVYSPIYAIQDNTGVNNIEIRSSLASLNNTFIGKDAGRYNTKGSYNSAQGANALSYNSTGSYNSAQGVNALLSTSTGSYNSAQGVNALFSNTTGNNNSAHGHNALFSNTTGNNNSAQGVNALFYNSNGSYNSAQGYNAGRYLANGSTGRTTGNNGLYLGFNTKASADGTDNEIVIGYNAIGKGSNTAVYGNTSMLKHIFSNGNMAVGYTTESQSTNYKLSVNGNGYFNTDLTINGLAGTGTRLATVGADGKLGASTELATNIQSKSDTTTWDATRSWVINQEYIGKTDIEDSHLATIAMVDDSTKYLKENAIGSISISVSGERLALNQTKVIGGTPVSDIIQRVTTDHDGLMTKDQLKRLTDTVPNLFGTLNHLAKITDVNTLGNSIASESDTTITVNGNINSTGGFFKNGVEITGGGGAIGDSYIKNQDTVNQVANIRISGNIGLGIAPTSKLQIESTTGEIIKIQNGTSVYFIVNGIANNTNAIGLYSGKGATNASYSNFFAPYSGNGAANASYSNFFGNFSGFQATNASYSNFFGNFSGDRAANASYSNLLGYSVGKTFTNNNIGSNNIIIGTNISLPNAASNSINIGGVLFGTGTYSATSGNPSITPATSGKIGIRKVNPAYTLDVNGSVNGDSAIFGNMRMTNGAGLNKIIYSDASGNFIWGNQSATLLAIAGVTPSPGYLYYNGSTFSYGSSGSMVYPLTTGLAYFNGTSWGSSRTAPSGEIVGTTDSQALTNKSVNGVTLSTGEGNNKILFGDGTYKIINGVQTLTSASSITMNFATAPKASLSLATNGTISITNVPDGGEGSIEVTSSGAYTLAIAGSTGYTTTQKMGTVSAIASSAHTTVFYWRSGSTLYYGFLLNN